MKWSILKAWFAGFVGTTIITLMVYFVSPDLTGGPSDLAALMASLMGVSWVTGLAAHFAIGTLVLPTVYALVFNRLLHGGSGVRGMTWGLLLWLVSQTLVIPATGGGFFSATGGGVRAVLDSLIAHLLYGWILGVLTGSPREGAFATGHAYDPGPQAPRAA